MKDKLIWYLKQLLPLTYRTVYGDGNEIPHYVTWNMWMGRCYNVEDVRPNEYGGLTINYGESAYTMRVGPS